MLGFIIGKGDKAKISKGNRHMEQGLEGTRHKLPESSPSEVTQDTLESSSTEVWQPPSEKLTTTQCLRSLLEVRHVGTLCLAHIKFQTPREHHTFIKYHIFAQSISTGSHYHFGKLFYLCRKLFTIHIPRG